MSECKAPRQKTAANERAGAAAVPGKRRNMRCKEQCWGAVSWRCPDPETAENQGVWA